VFGNKVQDARLVAIMNVHHVSHLLTFNTGDFSRYPGFTVIDPSKVDPLQ